MILTIKKNLHLFVLFLLFIFVCGPLFSISSFGPGDDLNYVERFKSSSFFFRELKNFFIEKPVFFQRPISAFFIALSHFFFKDNFALYMYFFFLLFLTTNFFIYKSIKLLTDQTVANTFLIISSTPFLTSSFLQSPYLFSELILPTLFWSVSFFYLVLSLKNQKNYFLISHLFLLVSLLCTVISFPLFLINLLLPFLFYSKKYFFKKFFLKIVLPLFFVLFIYFIYLFYIKFFFNSNIYGYSSININSVYQGIYYYFVIFVEFPIMLLESLKFSILLEFLIILTLVTFFFYLDKKNKIINNPLKKKINLNFFFIISLLSLLANSLIFFISNYPSVTFGYYNRMLISAFISLCLVLSILLNLKKNYFFFFKIIIISLILNSTKVITNQIKEIEIIKKNEINILIKALYPYRNNSKNIILVAKLPLYLTNNFNNLEIFWLTWNLDILLKKEKINFHLTYPLSNQTLAMKDYQPAHNFFNAIEHLKKRDIDLYLYTEEGQVYEFLVVDDLLNYLLLQKKKILPTNLITREFLRLRFKNYFRS